MYQGGCDKARRPLPPRPDCRAPPPGHTVPLKVWVIASASCFAVCAALVLATVVVTRWGAGSYPAREYAEIPEPIFANQYHNAKVIAQPAKDAEDIDNEIQYPILEKLSIFKNVVGNRDRKHPDTLAAKPQIHPVHDTSLHHPEKKIEKKDQAVFEDSKSKMASYFKTEFGKANPKILAGLEKIPEFKPTLPDIFTKEDVKLEYVAGLRKLDYDDYYNDENLYDDYMQSNTMTNYLIEKVQELHDWITSDPDFKDNATKKHTNDEFGQLLKALNESLLEGNATIVLTKLKDIYLGDDFTNTNDSRTVLSNGTDLLSFGVLTLDVMLLHNIQLMAWENQSVRAQMLQQPDVFAFTALFLEPAALARYHRDAQGKRGGWLEEAGAGVTGAAGAGGGLLDAALELGLSAARAALHLARAYRNTRAPGGGSREGGGERRGELECVRLLYCRNLVLTAALPAPYGALARLSGIALRVSAGEAGELSAARALSAALYEALVGWREPRCDDMFPRCSKVDAAAVVLDSILPASRKQPPSRS